MTDSIAGLTINPLRASGGWKPKTTRKLAQYTEHVPFSNKNVVSKGGLEEETWTGACDMTEAVYNSLVTTYLPSEVAVTIVLDGVTRSGWLMDVGSAALLRTLVRANLTLVFDT